jgi:hypothetical protein
MVLEGDWMRYKRIAINCHADLFAGEGEVKIKPFFSGLSPLMKCDLLQDWKSDIDHLYDSALKEWRRELIKGNPAHSKEVKSFVLDAEDMIKDAEIELSGNITVEKEDA